MKNNKKAKTILITCVVVLLVAAATARVTNGWRNWGVNPGKEEKEEAALGTVMDETNIGTVTNDDPWKEMEKLVEVYHGGDQQVSYSGKMRLMDDNEDEQKLLEEHLFDYSFFKGQYYYKLGPIECVGKEKFILIANHQDKTIALSAVIPSSKKQKNFLDMEQFRQVMKAGKANAKVTRSGAEKVITVDNLQDPVVQGYQVFYDPASYRINKIIIGMIRFEPLESTTENTSPATGASKNEDIDMEENEVTGYSYMLEIIYEKTDRVTIDADAFHPESKFIRIVGKEIQLADNYKNYQLAN